LEYFGFGSHGTFSDARPSAITFCLACGKPINASEDVLELRAGMFSQGVAANFGGRRAEPVFLHSRSKDRCLSDSALHDALRGLGIERPVIRPDLVGKSEAFLKVAPAKASKSAVAKPAKIPARRPAAKTTKPQ
jgi:hypothetical protein